jgi:flagellar biosynthesis chaperone FliJ
MSKDPMQVQRQIKQNMEDLQSYLSDLNSWTQEMDKKDKDIINKKQTTVRVCNPQIQIS